MRFMCSTLTWTSTANPSMGFSSLEELLDASGINNLDGVSLVSDGKDCDSFVCAPGMCVC